MQAFYHIVHQFEEVLVQQVTSPVQAATMTSQRFRSLHKTHEALPASAWMKFNLVHHWSNIRFNEVSFRDDGHDDLRHLLHELVFHHTNARLLYRYRHIFPK